MPCSFISFLQFDLFIYYCLVCLFESVQPLADVVGELGDVLARYEPCGQVDYVVEHLVAIAGRRAQIAVATRSTSSALVAHLTLSEQCMVFYAIKSFNNEQSKYKRR